MSARSDDKHNRQGNDDMTDLAQELAAQYAQAIELEKSAWHALQAHAPGSPDRAVAWAAWSEAISRTNRAWRQLSSHTLSSPHHAHPAAAPEMLQPPAISARHAPSH
jgi:hypothetical protein